MRRQFRFTLRLKPSILTAFVVLTVPVFAGLIWLNYTSNDAIARAHANRLIDRFRAEAIENIQDDFDKVKWHVAAAATLGNEYPGFYADNRALKYFFSVLRPADSILSFYVGMEDGSFRQARRIEPNVDVFGRRPPASTQYAWRLVEPRSGQPTQDRYIFLDGTQRELGQIAVSSDYDPRPRFWYRRAVAEGTTMITDPDVFAALDLVGFTVAAPFYADGKLAGVVGADITLDLLSDYLAARKITPGSKSYMLDHQGRVLATSDRIKTYANVHGRVELLHVTTLESDLPAIAFGARPRGKEAYYGFSHDGREYVASLTSMPESFGKRWQVFVITPLTDFTGPFADNNSRLLGFGIIAIALEILIIYLLASVISRPLERLAVKVDRVQDLDQPSLPPVVSPVREIAALSRAIDTLDSAVKSFAAFVPIGLVRQLLETEQKLELGGHSRFLTIFFSDLESFSTLSEEVPSQELLLRVSAYLEVVTHAVNEEHGTIDKFVGDGVMAFWGAPALLEDHAWRACVAALRIQRGMAALNARWIAEGLKPLYLRIGIHSDAVLVGNIGSRERMAYTVMGDGVNVAARLEGINRDYGTRLCISHNVYKEAGERLCVRPIDDVAVKGRRSKIPIYELLGVYGAAPELEPAPDAVALARLSRAAYDALVQDDVALAAERYQEILRQFPTDPVALEQSRRLASAVRIDSRARGPLARS